MIIIGIDPGSRITGYGLVQIKGDRYRYIDSGCIKATADTFPSRLITIHQALTDIVQQYRPGEAAVENVFVHTNPNSAIKLGQARGAAIVALGGCDISEYTPRQVKQAVVGYGAADKKQVQHMVIRLLNYQNPLQTDESDALAIALCHAQSRNSIMKILKNQQKDKVSEK